MKVTILALVILMVLAAGCGPAAQETPVATDVQIDLTVEPAPPAAGDATLIITLTESDGTPIDGATVRVHGDMDHEGMTPVDGETDASTNGVYRVPFQWTMGGGWILEVTAVLPDDRGVATETFNLFVEAVSHGSVINQDDEGSGMDMDMGDGEEGNMNMDDSGNMTTDSESGQ